MSRATIIATAAIVVAATSGCDRMLVPTAQRDLPRVQIDALAGVQLEALSSISFTIREDLGTLGGTISGASDINNLNQVTGYSFTSGDACCRAFLWTPADGMIDINAGGATMALYGNALNDAGQIAAQGLAPSTIGAAAVRGSPPYPSAPLDLGKLGGFDAFGYGINSAGDVVGSSENPAAHPFRWVAPGPMQDLGTLGGGYGYASAINDAGTVAGASSQAGGSLRAFRWTANGGMVNLGTLGGTESAGAGINSAGDIVGWAKTAQGAQHAARWPAGGGGPLDLGTFLGGASSSAVAINTNGFIAGSSANAIGNTLGVRWSSTGGMKQLNPIPGGSNSAANGINDGGHTAGYSDVSGGGQHAVVWWYYYRPIDIFICDCRLVASPYKGTMGILVPGGRAFDIASVEPRLFMLGDGRGEDVPLFLQDRRGGDAAVIRQDSRPLYEVKDVNGDGYTDMVLYFDHAELMKQGELTANTNHLTLTGALRDRSKGVYGGIVLSRIE